MGLKEGLGTHTKINGENYIGEFKNDDFHGKGKLMFPDGSFYDGNWVNGMKHGEGGEIHLANGKIIKGNFVNDVLNGPGLIIENGI